MTRSEETNNRPGHYSKRHREWLDSLKQMDVDEIVQSRLIDGDEYEGYGGNTWLENNQKQFGPSWDYKPVALVESISCSDSKWSDGNDTKPEDRWPMFKWKKRPLRLLSEWSGLPAFGVWHPHSCDEFYVKNLQTGNSELLSESRYISLLEYIRGNRTDQIEPFGVYQAETEGADD